MRVVQIIAVRRERDAGTEEPGLWRHDRDLAAGGYLLHAQAAFTFTPAVGHESAVRRNAGKIYDLSVLGKLADADVASINGGGASAQEFVNPECRSEHQQYQEPQRPRQTHPCAGAPR